MRKLVLLIILAVPSWAAIARLGSCSGTTSCTPGTTGVFALEIASAFDSASRTAPTNAAWTLIGSEITPTTGTVASMSVFCRVSISATPAASGTFGNTTNVGIVTYSGTGARSTGSCADWVIGGSAATYAKTSNTVSYNTITMTNGGGTSWVIGTMGDSTTGNACTPTGMTVVAGATTGFESMSDTNGAVSSWATTTCNPATGSTTWTSYVVEILVPPANPPVISQLVNGDGGAYISAGNNAGNPITKWIDPALAGNGLIIPIAYTYSASRTVAISDGYESATKLVSCDDAGNGISGAIYYIQNLTAGATTLTFTFDAALSLFSESHHQFSGVLTTGTPNDGTPSCNVNVTPSANTIGNLADATGVSTSNDGDLVYSAVFDETAINDGAPFSTITDMIPGSGYTGLFTAIESGHMAEAKIQAAHALIKPSMTIAQATYDTFIVMTAALNTSAGAGTARTTGKIIRQSMGQINTGTGVTTPFAFPCDTGNFVVLVMENNGPNITAIVDTSGNSWGHNVPGGATYAQYWYVGPITCNGQLFAEMTYTAGVSIYKLFELSNAAASSPVDTGSAASATFSTAAATTLGTGGITTTGTGPWPLVAAGGIANGDYLMISTEIVKVASGGGTTSVTLTRGQFNTTALGTIAAGTNVIESLQSPKPAITTGSNNEVVFCAMNQGTGPNWNTLNATYDFGSYPQQGDGSTNWANGDGICHAYVATASTVNIGWYLANQDAVGEFAQTNAIGVKLATLATSVIPGPFIGSGVP